MSIDGPGEVGLNPWDDGRVGKCELCSGLARGWLWCRGSRQAGTTAPLRALGSPTVLGWYGKGRGPRRMAREDLSCLDSFTR